MPTDEENTAAAALAKARSERDLQDVKTAFSGRLTAKMEEKGLNQTALADRAAAFMANGQFDRTMLSRALSVKRLPTPLHINAIAKALGVTPEYLLTPTESKRARRSFHFEELPDGRIEVDIHRTFDRETGIKIMTLVGGAK